MTYKPKITTFACPLSFNALAQWLRVGPFELLIKPHLAKTRVLGLTVSEGLLISAWVVLTHYQRVMDGQTDRQTDTLKIVRTVLVLCSLLYRSVVETAYCYSTKFRFIIAPFAAQCRRQMLLVDENDFTNLLGSFIVFSR